MTPERAALLANCNGMGCYSGRLIRGAKHYDPFERQGDIYYTHLGNSRMVVEPGPDEWKPMTVDEIVAEMDRAGWVPYDSRESAA